MGIFVLNFKYVLYVMVCSFTHINSSSLEIISVCLQFHMRPAVNVADLRLLRCLRTSARFSRSWCQAVKPHW